MKYLSWDKKNTITLLDCPFCGGIPVVEHIGNDYTKTRGIKIKCLDCRIQRIDRAMVRDFDFLEKVSAKAWNKRIVE